jgi:DNA-binding PadR family transcriptional regulator
MELKLSEFAELCLTELYDRTRPHNYALTQYFPKIVKKFGEVSYATIEEIAQHLQGQGCIKVMARQMGSAETVTQVQITPFGVATVESGGVTAVIEYYRQDPSLFRECQVQTPISSHKDRFPK